MTLEEEIAGLKEWNGTLVKKHDKIVKEKAQGLYKAREAGFTWGMGTILVIMLTVMWIDNTYDFETLVGNNKVLTGVATAAIVAFYRGMNWLGVERHKPKDKDK